MASYTTYVCPECGNKSAIVPTEPEKDYSHSDPQADRQLVYTWVCWICNTKRGFKTRGEAITDLIGS